MRFRVTTLVPLAVLFCVSLAWGETALFKAFFEHREVVTSVFFGRGSSELDKAAAAELGAALERIRGLTCASRLIRIEGFAGQEGSAENAFRLSMNRANAVARFLETRGVACLVGVSGYGALQSSPQGNADGLRVEIAAYPKMFIFDFDNARHVDVREFAP